jgi:UPF0716 protein FxsA
MRGLLLLILAAPLIELWFLIRVGSSLGAITTIFLLVAAGMIGMSLLRQQSFSTLLRVEQRLQTGELPATEILEGFVLSLAAILLIIPGFITDLLAIPLLIPPLRRGLVRRILSSGYYETRFRATSYSTGNTNSGNPNSGNADPFRNSTGGEIIDGEWRREDDPRLR